MGKLLELAMHCINDFKFYGSQEAPSIEIITGHGVPYYLTNSSIRWANNTKPIRNFNVQFDIDMDIMNKYRPRPADNVITPSFHPQLKIVFEDEPPIHISYMHVMEDTSIVTGTYNDQKRYFGLFKRTTPHVYECSTRNYKHRFFIRCGSITEDITLERYRLLVETYQANYTRNQNAADQAKIDERLNFYK